MPTRPIPPDDASTTRSLAIVGQLAFIAMVALLVYSFVVVTRDGEIRRRCGAVCALQPNYMGAARKVPSFSLKDLNGNVISAESYRGKVLVLHFWTKTCQPCLEEMPEVAEFAKLVRAKSDVAFVTISTDDGPNEIVPVLKSIFKEAPPLPVLVDADAKAVADKFGTTLFPETWIIDKRGVIRARFDGTREWTSPAVLEFIDQVRDGGYCPVDIQAGQISGEGAQICVQKG